MQGEHIACNTTEVQLRLPGDARQWSRMTQQRQDGGAWTMGSQREAATQGDVAAGEPRQAGWWRRRWIETGSGPVNSLWHCFGVEHERVVPTTALAMLAASETALLPVNTHRVVDAPRRRSLLIGHGDVTLDMVATELGLDDFVPCLNINLQTSAAAAIALAHGARDLSGLSLLKLEVLTADKTNSDDAALGEATAALQDDGFVVMPLISTNLDAARRLVEDHGVGLLRVMGSPIGSGRGIEDPVAFRAICALGVPVILDGGIGGIEDFVRALELGAVGGLVNSMLFRDDRPADTLRKLSHELNETSVPARLLDRMVAA
jgi:thiazole synthase